MDQNAKAIRPAALRETEDLPARDTADDQIERQLEGAPDALARLSDPSFAGRREQIAAKVKDRSRLQWVPASELLRRGTQHSGDVIAGGQERLHRLVRDQTTAGVVGTARATSVRIAALGRPRSTATTPTISPVTRNAP